MKKQTILTKEPFTGQPPMEGTIGYVYIEDVYSEGEIPVPQIFEVAEVVEKE